MMDDEDDALVAELRAAAKTFDPVPPNVLASAFASWTWRTIDAELAELVYDSADEREPAGVRGTTAGPRLVTFSAAGAALEVEVEITVEGGGCRLEGQLLPPSSGVIDVEHPLGSVNTTADDAGRFSARDVPPGPVRLRITRGGSAGSVTTSWTAL